MCVHLERLFRHLAWADAQVLDLVERMAAPSPQVLRLLGHLYQAESIWLGRIQGTAAGAGTPWAPRDLAACRDLAEATGPGFLDLLARTDAAALEAQVHYQTSKGEPMATPLGDILLHVALHGAYHRGQIAQLARLEGSEPVATDYILFARQRPEAATR